MIEIDCRKCSNLADVVHGCKRYGPDAGKAVAACAADGFKHYAMQGGQRMKRCKCCGEEYTDGNN